MPLTVPDPQATYSIQQAAECLPSRFAHREHATPKHVRQLCQQGVLKASRCKRGASLRAVWVITGQALLDYLGLDALSRPAPRTAHERQRDLDRVDESLRRKGMSV